MVFRAKDEVKKALIAEPIKFVLSTIFVALLSWVSWLVPVAYQLFWVDLPRWASVTIILLLTCLVFATLRLFSRPKIPNNQKSDAARKVDLDYDPDEVDTQILLHLYHDKIGMNASLVSQLLRISLGDADYRLIRLAEAGFVHQPGWAVGSADYALTTKSKELIFKNGSA